MLYTAEMPTSKVVSDSEIELASLRDGDCRKFGMLCGEVEAQGESARVHGRISLCMTLPLVNWRN